jgi:hypothetical protein
MGIGPAELLVFFIGLLLVAGLVVGVTLLVLATIRRTNRG